MTKDEARQRILDAARRQYEQHVDGDLEIDDDAKFSIADPPDDGLYVQAWVWVRITDIPELTNELLKELGDG